MKILISDKMSNKVEDVLKSKQINFDIDRYIIDSTTGNSNEQYILFPNYEYNV